MRQSYIVTYDITDPKRLRNVYKKMLGYGDHLQLSVFYCELSDKEKALMKTDLSRIINNAEDQVLLVDIGPSEGRGRSSIESMGLRYQIPDARAVIV